MLEDQKIGHRRSTSELHWDLSKIYQSIESDKFIDAVRKAHAQAKNLRDKGAAISASDKAFNALAIDRFDCDWQVNRDLIQELFVYANAHQLLGDDRPHVGRARETTVKLAALNQTAPRPIVARLRAMEESQKNALLTQMKPRDRYIRWLGASASPTRKAQGIAAAEYSVILERLQVPPAPYAEPTSKLAATITRRALWKEPPETRAYLAQALKKAWAPHRDIVARAIFERCRKQEGKVAFADMLAEDGVSLETAQSVQNSLAKVRPKIQPVLKLQARLLGVAAVDALDLTGWWPGSGQITLEDTIGDVRRAFAALDPGMAQFLDTALENGWIDARPARAGRSVSDLQTGISRRGCPLVLVNFDGLPRNAVRFAHECAHAYHFHLVQDRPAERHAIPTPLAETVSAFAEQALRDVWAEDGRTGCRDAAQRFAWMEAEAIFSSMLQLPKNAAFEIQVSDFDRSPDPSDLTKISKDLGAYWFGPDLRGNDAQGWSTVPAFATARPLHGLPYMIGFLAAHSLNGPKPFQGADFRALLARMADETTETVLTRVLGGAVNEQRTWEAATERVHQRLKALSVYIDTYIPCAVPGAGS